MFSQAPEESSRAPSISSHKQKNSRKKRKKQKQKNKKKQAQAAQANQSISIANTMLDWSDNFSMANAWQWKHQLAMWKAKAAGLEYENQVLRETLRQFYVYGKSDDTPNTSWNVNKTNEQSYVETDSSENEPADDSEEGSEPELTISDEYMAFLKQNYLFRKARDERKKKEAEEEKRVQEQVVMNPQPPPDRIAEYKELYGEDWQRIVALDTHLQSEFMSFCDREKPSYWPNIPLNIQF